MEEKLKNLFKLGGVYARAASLLNFSWRKYNTQMDEADDEIKNIAKEIAAAEKKAKLKKVRKFINTI